jgi:cytochrome-b5 reductase
MLRLGRMRSLASAAAAATAAAVLSLTTVDSGSNGSLGTPPAALRFNALLRRAAGTWSAEAQSLDLRLGGGQLVLRPDAWTSWKLVRATAETPTTKRLVLEPIADPESGITVATSTPLEIPPISCVLFRATPGEPAGEPVVRPYNPISPRYTNGPLTFLVRQYPDGRMSNLLHDMRPGDTIQLKGPFEQYRFVEKDHANQQIVFIAGGTGLTPCLQLIHDLVERQREPEPEKRPSKLTLIFANNTEMEILLREELDEMAASSNGFLDIHYLVREAPLVPGPQLMQGIVSRRYLEERLPPPEQNPLIFVCGPPGMMELVSGPKTKDKKQGQLAGILRDLGYTESHVWKLNATIYPNLLEWYAAAPL